MVYEEAIHAVRVETYQALEVDSFVLVPIQTKGAQPPLYRAVLAAPVQTKAVQPPLCRAVLAAPVRAAGLDPSCGPTGVAILQQFDDRNPHGLDSQLEVSDPL